MKIRSGFVSNSSSSSFILLLPKNFDPVKYTDNMTDEEIHEINKWDDWTREDVKSALVMLWKQKEIWSDDYREMSICSEALSKYIIGSTESGPDSGTISIISDKERQTIKDILNIELRYDKLKKIKENEN